MDDKTVRKAIVIAQAMELDGNPSKKGSYAHSWHCRIANMCLDAIEDAELERDNYSEGINSYAVANDAASRVLKLLFDIDAKYLSDISTEAKD
jgi:hypothetical protein